MNLHGETLSLFYDLLPQEVEHKVGGLSTKKRCPSRLSGPGQLGVQLFHHRHMVDRWRPAAGLYSIFPVQVSACLVLAASGVSGAIKNLPSFHKVSTASKADLESQPGMQHTGFSRIKNSFNIFYSNFCSFKIP